jgi:hypothetical protein
VATWPIRFYLGCQLLDSERAKDTQVRRKGKASKRGIILDETGIPTKSGVSVLETNLEPSQDLKNDRSHREDNFPSSTSKENVLRTYTIKSLPSIWIQSFRELDDLCFVSATSFRLQSLGFSFMTKR